jgi:carbamoyltransferase
MVKERNLPFKRFEKDSDLYQHVSNLLAEGKIVGWFGGRMEFGPRALGGRSIIGDARNSKMQSTMNVKVKFRESFRPFAPCVLQEKVQDWFEMKPSQESPYMLLVAPVQSRHHVPLLPAQVRTMKQDPDLRHRVNIVRSAVPAITHVDYSARVQTVDAERNPRFHGLLKTFEQQTGCPVLVNTSFNVRGEPIVCTPEDAYHCFMATDIDALVLEDVVLHKDELKNNMTSEEREKYLAQFQLD